jgi:bacterial leucyl aminopeptidase
MNEIKVSAIFFDIEGSLETPKILPSPSRLEGLDIYPYIPNVLQWHKR